MTIETFNLKQSTVGIIEESHSPEEHDTLPRLNHRSSEMDANVFKSQYQSKFGKATTEILPNDNKRAFAEMLGLKEEESAEAKPAGQKTISVALQPDSPSYTIRIAKQKEQVRK